MTVQQQHTFPTLKYEEILPCLADLQISCTLEDLMKPTSARIIPIYEAFTDILMGFTQEQLFEPNFSIIEILEYPDIHTGTISFMTFYRNL